LEFQPKIKEKVWAPEIEKNVLQEWFKNKSYYSFNAKTKKKIFSIDTPPPYPSGAIWHIGAVVHYSQIDMIARTARMLGFEVFFPIGIDRNGVPVEKYTEKKYGIIMHETPREKFIELAKTALDDLEAKMIEIMKRIGLSGDFDNYYRTDSEEYRKLTQETFLMLWEKGLIYKATRPNNYCVDCRTTIADADIVYEEIPTQLVYIKFKISGKDEFITIATTRPELICSCQAILVNPQDERYKHLKGQKAVLPIYGREVPILEHPIVKPEFGSGAEMVCSYGDTADVRLFRELGLKEIMAINLDGRMNENYGNYAGLEVKEARAKIIEDLESLGLVEKKEIINHRTPVCERSKTPIEIISLDEFYLKQIPFLEDLKKIAEKIIFHPEQHKQILYDWINSIIIDWPISRRRFYGTEIPIWYCKNCGNPNLPKPGKYYQPWREEPPFKECKYCKSNEFVGDTRTLDTWFDSSISPLFISKFLRDEEFFKKTFPNSLRPQGKDIVRTWLYYTLLRCYQLTGKQPWKHAWIMGYVVDEKGQKMSKSKGNVIDPLPIIEKYGADVFRFWGAQEASLGSNFKVSEERIVRVRNFITKLWNIARYVSMFPKVKNAKLVATDKWILSELNNLIERCMKGYKDFNFYIPSNAIRDFVWNIFASHYIEMVKPRTYGQGFNEEEVKSAWFTLHTVLESILSLLAPIIPFMTDYLSREIYGYSIHEKKFPKAKWNFGLDKFTKDLIEFNSMVWNQKKKEGLSLKESIKINIPDKLKDFEKDLIAMHNIKI